MSGINTSLGNTIGSVLPILRSRRDTEIVAAVREEERQLRGVAQAILRERVDRVRSLVSHQSVDVPRARIEAFSICCESLRQACGIDLYDVQLLGASALAAGAIAEMQTGEGKTFACAPAAFLHSLTERGVHVATTNQYLAGRDYEILLPAYRLLGVRVGLLPERTASTAEKRDAYRCDITYGTGYEFGFDYLRDQLAMRRTFQQTLGSATLENLAGHSTSHKALVQRDLYYSIVDEADNVLVDDAASPLILSGPAAGEAADAVVHRAARKIIQKLRPDHHFLLLSSGNRCQLTDAGIAAIHDGVDDIPIERLQRTWAEYVEQALQAAALRRDVHYIVASDQKVQIVDSSTGRIFSDRTWSDGLHQAVEAKEGVPITPEKLPLAQITRQRFSRLYERLAGMTGTAAGCEREFRDVYGLSVTPIALRTQSRRQLWPTRFFAGSSQKWQAIGDSVAAIHLQHRPILIGTASISDSERLAELLRERGLTFQLLNGRQDADEAAVIAEAGRRGAVTIATSLAGRGTDIKLATGVAELGGLHVIVSECNESARIDRQLIGRGARQGDPGSAQMFVSGGDSVIQQYGDWFVASLHRHAGPNGEVPLNLTRQLRRIQRSAERASYATRCGLLRRDLSRDSLFSRQIIDS